MHSVLYLAGVLVAIIATLHQIPSTSALVTNVSNEQLRDGLLSLVNSFNQLENKLDRHEQRERALGDVIKRGLQTLQKGQRIFEPMNRTSTRMEGTFTRLDERVSQVETMILAMDDAQKKQQENVNGSLQKILKWMADRDAKDAKAAAEHAATAAKDVDDDEEDLSKKIEDMSDNVKRLSQQIAEAVADRASSETSSKNLLAQTERLVNSKMSSADEIVTKMEEKLSTFYFTGLAATTVAPVPLRNTEWESSVQTSLSTIETNLKDIRSVQSVASNAHLDKDFFMTIANETMEALEDMRIEVLAASDKSFTKTSMRIKEATTTLDSSVSEVLRTLSESSPSNDEDGGNHKHPSDLHTIVASLGNLEKIILTTDESIMKILRSIEINKRTIPQDIEESLKTHVASINEALNTKFGILGETIHANHDGSLTNLTSKIESEVSLVWRQIGNIAQDVQMSKSSLNKLHEQTENYVNGTSSVMDRMGGKVSQITSRMAEVDSNLNFLLGRLSLVTQEFNNTREGLGIALDQLKDSFKAVQDKIRAVGPGPHRIDSNENETDYNMVPQNDQPAPAAPTPQ